MYLQGIRFHPVWAAAGVHGFFGWREYWHYRLFQRIMPGFTFDGVTFVTKTSPANKHVGNMPLTKDWKPRERFPRCIKVYPRRGMMLNAVGLSSPGFSALLEFGTWQEQREPFQISYMPIKRDRDARLSETRTLVTLLRPRLSEFCAHIALQLNISCPNTGHDALAMVRETPEHLDLLSELRIPLIVKLNLLTPIEDACTIAEHDACAALIISNTVPFGQSDVIDWQRLFPKGSPLAQYGGGGLSGSPLFPFMIGWIIKARHIGLTKPIIACGGIDRPSRVEEAWTAGANGISFATVATTRPWRLKSIIATANTLWS